jgi:RNA polymerase sigma-70 factor (ECF subfamily)
MEETERIEGDERQLVEAAQHNPQAFGTLYDRYIDRIYAFAYRRTGGDEALAGDITSATFEQALRHIQRYRWQGFSFGAWLYKIARNELAQHYRRSRPLSFLGLGRAEQDEIDIEAEVDSALQRDTIHLALKKLSDGDREIITLRFFEGLSSPEVSEVLGCSVDNVYLRLHRALGRMRKHLEEFESKGKANGSA